jgi:hypothetical protein
MAVPATAVYIGGLACTPDGAMYVQMVDGATQANPTFTGVAKFPNGTAAAPSIAFSSDPQIGIHCEFSAICFDAGGATNARIDANNIYFFEVTQHSSDLISAAATPRLGTPANPFASAHTSQGLLNGTTKTLTESSATGLCEVAIASGARTSGELHVVIEADDATDFQARHMRVPFTAVNKAGVITTTLGTPVETVSVSAGTLTCTLTITTGASKIILNANAVSSLTQTTLRAKWKLVSTDTLTITAL